MSPQKKNYEPVKDQLRRLAVKLTSTRKKFGYSQEDLAAHLDRHRSFISHIENLRKYPSVEILMRLAKLYDMDIKEFF